MNNHKYVFKTNLNCSSCVARVKNDLDDNKLITEWQVDTQHPDKLLTIYGNKLLPDAVISAIKDKGFSITLLS